MPRPLSAYFGSPSSASSSYSPAHTRARSHTAGEDLLPFSHVRGPIASSPPHSSSSRSYRQAGLIEQGLPLQLGSSPLPAAPLLPPVLPPAPAPAPPPPRTSTTARAASLSRRSQMQQQQQQQQQGQQGQHHPRTAMVGSPLPHPASAFDHHPHPGGDVDATAMRRGVSYDGASASVSASASSSRPASLVPGAYTPSSSSTLAGAGQHAQGGRDLYSPMTGVQLASTASSASTSGSASSPHLPFMSPSPSREYSPAQYSAAAAAYAAAPPSGFASAPPLHPRDPHQHQHQQQVSASSFYPQHIAQSYPSAHSPSSGSAAAAALPLPPPSAPPVAGGGSSAAHGHAYGLSALGRQPSLSAQHPHSPHHQHHGSHGYPAASTSPLYAPLASAATSSTDLRNLSLSGAHAHQQQGMPRRRRGLVRVREGEEIERGGATRGGQPRGRRADPAGGFVSPLKALTVALPQTYHLVNPAFVYETSRNPRRVLTKPSKPASNEGFDNEDSDYILYVNDVLGPEDKDRYLILDVLGQGTFGQVVKCQNMKTHEIVAVKVVKNKPAYFQQSMMEVTILELINNQWDKDDEHHMLRLKDTFIHHSHLCLVFELLSNNLYELIKQNSFRGLSTSLVRVFTAQLLDALSVLNEAKIIHCDLKPENILLKSLQSPTIKVIDFGSACHEKQTVYTYIQSRFYRSPEVILSLPYSSMIDMWSLGCICVELFLGLPLFPGTSEFNQITRIVEMLGMPPDHMLDKGKQTSHFFEHFSDEYGRRRYRLKSLERYAQEYKANEQPSKKYFSASTLPEIIKQYPIVRKGLKEAEVDKEMLNRIAFIDFVQGLLHLDPEQRWSPQQARLHPFVLGEPLLAPFVPPPRHLVAKGGAASPTEIAAAKQQQQQQALARQAQAQGYAASGQAGARRPYDAKAYQQQHLGGQQQQQQQQAYVAAGQGPRGANNPYAAQPFDARQAAQQSSLYGAAAGGFAPRSVPAGAAGGAQAMVANPPAVHHAYGGGRQRSGTDAPLPPALQKLGHELTAGAMGAGQSITPVLRRDDQWQAWEQQYGPGAVAGGNALARRISVSGRHPHLNLLQEQAEAGLHSWNSPVRAKPPPGAAVGGLYSPAQTLGYYASPLQPSSSQFAVVVDHSSPAGSTRPPSDLFDPISAPPLAYAAGGNPSARYAPYPTGGGGGAPLPPSGAAPLDPHAHPHAHAHAHGAGYDVFRTQQPGVADPLSTYAPLQPYTSPALGRGNGAPLGPGPGPGPPYGAQGQQGQGQGAKPPRGLW